jgi:hypothetical protein
MPTLSTSPHPVSSPNETSTQFPTQLQVLNIYLFIKALTFALTRKSKGGRVFADEFELEMEVPYSDALPLMQEYEFPCIVRANLKGFDVLLPADHLEAIQTRKGLSENIKMLSALPRYSSYAYLLRGAFNVHATWFPALYTPKMLRSIEGSGASN